MPARSPRQWLLGGIACGLVAVLLVRVGVALLVGGVRVLAVLAVVGMVWLISRRSGKRRHRP